MNCVGCSAELDAVGGNILVALETAQNLNITSIEVSTVDLDFLDLDAMAEKLGAGTGE